MTSASLWPSKSCARSSCWHTLTWEHEEEDGGEWFPALGRRGSGDVLTHGGSASDFPMNKARELQLMAGSSERRSIFTFYDDRAKQPICYLLSR